ncbi:MAG TPA: antirestriction protein ArdA [Dissulfurispiraceae bacterium]|nr:antirestriction protein ArdA [Dissulfurispiraceae bacterium]
MEQSNLNPERDANTPRIYVASLSDYNNGRLYGRWIDADQPAESIREQIAQMLAESKEPMAEEWAIHDYAGFGDLGLSESEDIDRLAEVAFLIKEHGDVFASLLAYLGGTSSVDHARRYMEEGYRGEYDNLTDYVQELIEDCYSDVLKGLPDFIRYHIDYDGIAHDMELNGDLLTFECDGKVHIFDGQV